MSPEVYESTGHLLRNLLTVAWLLPLIGFVIELYALRWSNRLSKAAAYLAVGCIVTGFVCSAAALGIWAERTGWWETFTAEEAAETQAGEEGAEPAHDDEQGAADHDEAGHGEHHPQTPAFFGTYYTLAHFGPLEISIDYYIDSLTLLMFVMVTLIASCIHVFAVGYMSDELTEDYVDHEVHLPGGGHFHRPGRYYRFFSFFSLFSFSMLGLVLAGNIFQVFVFWELVGLCSYLLIGFYVERRSASTAANKAFIMNRVGDFGFLIGLMIIWTWFGTFKFFDHPVGEQTAPGVFHLVRGDDGALDASESAGLVYLRDAEGHRATDESGRPRTIPYFLLVVAGLGVFAGCVGKSAQFPLQTWLPDAMEGPTPVSALVHSATMVAAGVYLAGRFYPVFTPEVLLTMAYVGCITLLLGATIAVVATDIKRVLAYSTISQLGYMMLAIGVAGWGAGLFHLVTHAFFKSLMFLCSGSVIVACHHVQEMPRMGGLLRKMPITGYTMLVGVIAICGLAIPVQIWGEPIAFSGYHSKDAIVATALAFSNLNQGHFLLFLIPLITAGITAFYMFRMWFYTFTGEPRDQEVYDHCHESPWVMTGPLLVLSFFAIFCAVGGEEGLLYSLLHDSQPQIAGAAAVGPVQLALPGHDDVIAVHSTAGLYALLVAVLGAVVAYMFYGARWLNPADVQRQFGALYAFLANKWGFDDLYDAMFVAPVHVVARWCTWVDKNVLDNLLHFLSRLTVDISRWDRRFDEAIVDGLVNRVGDATFAVGRSFRVLQTGLLRQYVMFIAVGVIALFALIFVFFPK